ncbi:hypothetical protein B0H12DRAFT_1072714 [Mycena haematopus]|nr:hypothetical protein B0H12DRAFT_1072714 [Mycena haematopus]
MGRRKNGKPVGRGSAFAGEKLEWLLTFENDFRTLARGSFYNSVTKQWLTWYGYDLPIEDNVPESVDDWEPVNRKEGLSGEALAKENDFQEAVRKNLRTKLSNWFRHRFMGKRLHSAGVDKILKRMHAMSGNASRPRRKTNVAVYSGRYYASKLKEGFDAVWEGAKEGLAPGARISMCQEYVRACLEVETEEVRAEIVAEADALQEAAMKEFRARNSVPEQSAEEYHNALETFDEVGIPLADVLSERLGMHVIILAVGPVGDQRGEVRLRSVFSDTSGGQTAKIWGEFDRAAFTAAEVSLTRYGRAFFTKDQCRERAWPPLDKEPLHGLDGLIPMGPEIPGSTVPPLLPLPPLPPPTPPLAPTPLSPASSPTPPGPASPPASPSPPVSRSPSPWPLLAPVERDQFWWSETQRDLYKVMQQKQWGSRYKDLIEAMVVYEESRLWNDGNLPRSSLRPEEIATWMKEHRKAGDFEKLKPNFGERMLAWWLAIGPGFRAGPRPEGVGEDLQWPPRPKKGEEPPGAWTMMAASGDNGMVLVVQALTWWGQSVVSAAAGEGLGAGEAALAANAEWQFMLEDVIYVLEAMTEELDDEDSERLARDRAEEIEDRAAAKKASEKRREAKKEVVKKGKKSAKKIPAPKAKTSATRGAASKPKQTKAVGEKPQKTRTQPKRKRDAGEDTAEDQPTVKKTRTEENVRPRPKPLFRGARGTEPDPAAVTVNADDGPVAPAEGNTTDDTPSEPVRTVAVDPAGPTTAPAHVPDAENHPFGNGFGDPFNASPADAMTAEERADLEAELLLDADADMEEDQGSEEGGED